MRLVILVLATVFCCINAMPFQPQPPTFAFQQMAPPPPPPSVNYMRPANLMPTAGMRMLSSTYKSPSSNHGPSYTPSHSPSPAPSYGSHPSYPGYHYPAPSHLNINNNNNNDNFNHNSEEAQARIHDESRGAANLHNQDLNDILAAYSLQSFLSSARPASYHSDSPRLKEKYSTHSYGGSNYGGSSHHGSSHHGSSSQYGSHGSSSHHGSSGSHHGSSGSHHGSSGSHHGSSGSHKGYTSHSTKDKYVKDSVKKDYGIPKSTKTDYTPKKQYNY